MTAGASGQEMSHRVEPVRLNLETHHKRMITIIFRVEVGFPLAPTSAVSPAWCL
jgi:hypothetical protein